MRLIFALRWDFAEHCVFAWVRVLVRVCMCVWALAGVGPYWQSVEVKQLVWTVESELGFWAWPPPPPSVQWNVPFGFRYSSYAECVSSFQPPLVFNMIILNSLILCWLLYLHFFPLHIVTLTRRPSQWRKTALDLLYSNPRESSSINEVRSGLLINVHHKKWMGPLYVCACMLSCMARRKKQAMLLARLWPRSRLQWFGCSPRLLAQRCQSCSSLNISSAWFTRGNHIASAAGGLSAALQTHRPNTIELILFSVHDYVHCWKTSRELFWRSINNWLCISVCVTACFYPCENKNSSFLRIFFFLRRPVVGFS